MALKARILRLEARQPVNLLADLSDAELEMRLVQVRAVLRARGEVGAFDDAWRVAGLSDDELEGFLAFAETVEKESASVH